MNICKHTSDIDIWIRRRRRGRVSGNTIKNGGNISPNKRGGGEQEMVGGEVTEITNAIYGGKGETEKEEQG